MTDQALRALIEQWRKNSTAYQRKANAQGKSPMAKKKKPKGVTFVLRPTGGRS